MTFFQALAIPAVILFFATGPASAAEALDGAQLKAAWGLPFAGILLSIALCPLLIPHTWHRRYPLFALGWALAVLIPLALAYGVPTALGALVHTTIAEYLSFIVLLFALYVIAGGILVTGDLHGTPAVNTVILAFGTVIASIVGTTGAAMILIRPLVRANIARKHNAHVVVFFIFLVCNIGGALSPLGDPPLFLGFLRGVDFFWTTVHLWEPTLFVAGIVLAVFVVLDVALSRRETVVWQRGDAPLRVHGLVNLVLLAGVIAAILASALWKPGIAFDIYGTPLELQNLLRDIALLALAGLSLWWTPNEHRAANGFTFEPIREVAILFAGIFVCIIPVMAMLQAGADGVFAPLIQLVTTPDGAQHNAMYFWMTGALSGFLDNAPTYLVFFGLAGGDPQVLMTTLAPTLAAISMGAVYMGAMTYIGNAPNFMVFAIAVGSGIRMPGFLGYMGWSCAVLLPVFALLMLVF